MGHPGMSNFMIMIITDILNHLLGEFHLFGIIPRNPHTARRDLIPNLW